MSRKNRMFMYEVLVTPEAQADFKSLDFFIARC
jgi:hypothetical protein